MQKKKKKRKKWWEGNVLSTFQLSSAFPIPAGVAAVGGLVRRHVPEAVFLESIGQEVTFVLPYGAARDGTFALLFQDLDRAIANLGLTSYGISDTTLEEVPLALAGGENGYTSRGTRSV